MTCRLAQTGDLCQNLKMLCPRGISLPLGQLGKGIAAQLRKILLALTQLYMQRDLRLFW